MLFAYICVFINDSKSDSITHSYHIPMPHLILKILLEKCGISASFLDLPLTRNRCKS